MQVFGEWAQVEVVELINDGSGLAFGIVGGRSSGVVVKSVLPGGVADRDGRLRSGDMLLRIGAVCVVGMCARQAAAVLRQCGARVRLLVARPAHNDPSLGASPAPIVPSRLLTEPAELERRLGEAGHEHFGAVSEDVPPPPTIIEERHLMRPVASIVAVVPRGALSTPRPPTIVCNPAEEEPPPMRLPLDMAIRGPKEPETLSYEVELIKDAVLGLGITVAGYVCEEEELSGIFVKSISAGSSADISGKIKVNDRIIEVDGLSLHGVSNHRAVALLRDASGPRVRLKALRYLRGAGFEKLQRALAAQGGVAPPSPSTTSLPKYSFSVYEESTVIDTELDSEAHHLPSPTSPSEEAEYVIGVDDEDAEREEVRREQDKWRGRLEADVDWPPREQGFRIIVGTVMKEKNTGLGISLEGTVRVVNGKEVQARHFIRAIAPDGPVAKLGIHQVGDELLEVNGWRVLGAHHVEVVSRLRAVTSPVRIVCARTIQDETQRSFTKNALGGSLQDLLSPPQRLIKAKSESSVVSICSASTVISGHGHDEFCIEALERNRSRSLEPLSGLAMWSDQVEYIELMKEDRGLGFSILDYLDPTEPGSSVIVVRSVVGGGAASADGRIAPGDRLLSVNGMDVSRSPLAAAVRAIKSAPRGIVKIGVAKPLPCSTVVGGQKANGHSLSSQECINSIASDDHTGMDSYHECLQEYGEGLEVVQICLEPEEASIKDEEVSAFEDMCIEEINKNNTERNKVNGKLSKSDDSVEHDDDLTITEDDVVTPRELPDLRIKTDEGTLSKQQSKDISTSDEMVFAVTPTGLERISFDKYWKENENKNEIKCDVTVGTVKIHDNNLLYIDHDIDGYETCVDDDSNSIKINEKTDARKTDSPKQRKNSDVSSKSIDPNITDDYYRPYVQEHIIKQMKSLHIEPLNVNIGKKKRKPQTKVKSPSKRECIEYYNDQAECLEEYKRQKQREEEDKLKEERFQSNLAIMEKKVQLKRQEPSEESTDLEVDDSHKCFLDSYEYEMQKAFIAEAKACKYCAVIREMLESSKILNDRRRSAPALVSLDSTTTSEDDDLLTVPEQKDRRLSAGPLKFVIPTRRLSFIPPPKMTVTVSPDRRADALVARRWGPPRKVTLSRNPGAPLGVSIVGGKVDIISTEDGDGDEKAIFGIFIKNVVQDSPAGNCGELGTGDRILEVDGVCVRSAAHERAVQLIKAAGNTVTLTVQSLLAWVSINTDSSDVDATPPRVSATPSKRSTAPPPPIGGSPEHEIKITVTSEPDPEKEPEEPPKPVSQYSDSESSDEEDERDLGGRTYSDKGKEIDRASAAAIKRSKEEKEADPEEEDDFGYTSNKIRKKYSGLGDSVVAVRLERSQTGLGISLAGHRDRSRMAVFVCGLHPAGAAAKAEPPVKLGDEILEVNGIVLHGRCHLNASAIIKGLPGPAFKIILLRRKQALEDVAVKPLTQFPVALEEESEDRFAGYKGVRNVSIKKGTSSLGIMIIEGRHAEVGQGIFISDIQEGSAAEQAGLQIGDMILAVNKDSLLGCSYDNAAATLKRTEGLVVLTVCNPNKKDDSPTDEPAGGGSIGGGSKGASRPASRNQTPDPGLKAGASRPQTPKPSPAKVEPPPDPATAPIQSNKETVIEITTNNQSLGLYLLGGSDTLINGAAAVILEAYPNGASGKDGRLKPGDYIVECGGVQITKEMTYERICLTIKQSAPKIKMTVHRPDPIPYTDVDVELTRKPGKGLGLCMMARTPPPGVFISEIIPGGVADLDGRIQKGDILHSVDGKDLSTSDHNACAVACKLAGPKAHIKLKRFKIVR